MNQDILEIPIVSENGDSIFSGSHYIVPIYQRAFAWGTGDSIRHNEILQLMDDVYESKSEIYRLGSLIVSHRGSNRFEVIDGQQRLTALYLILSRLGIQIDKGSLSYVCRPSAQAVLEGLAQDARFVGDGVSDNDPASGIVAGLRTIDQKIQRELQNNPQYKVILLRQFTRTVLCRIVVPENTDLNRYFEIMNTRGEQLEPQDIVKALLMANLEDNTEQAAFATVWDACSDMDGYCQMHFHDTNQRNLLFGNMWAELIPFMNHDVALKTIGSSCLNEAENTQSYSTFHGLVMREQRPEAQGIPPTQYSRFESIIDFRHFLLHSLNVFMPRDGREGTLNDNRLIEEFRKIIKQKQGEGAATAFVRDFILNLLKCRFLFDKYVIKRVYESNGRSVWCLNELVASSDGGASYRNTWQGNNMDNDNVRCLYP